MFIPAHRLEEAYNGIKQGALSGNSSVLIFVAPDADALCACKILLTLLKADFISYKVVPVAGYSDLTRANEELIDGNEELRSVVMLNCGGMVDLTELLSLDPEMTVYLVDSHRPLHLQNVFGSSQIKVLDDGEIEEELLEEKVAFEAIEFDDSDDESDSGSERGDDEVEEGEKDGEDDDDDDVGGERPRKTRRIELDDAISGQSAQATKRQARRVIARYYAGGTFYGGSVAGVVYVLCTQLARATRKFLWLAIVGLTDQYVFERIERDKYIAQYQLFKDEVARLSPPLPLENTGATEDNPYGNTNTRNPDQQMITCEDEYRFMHFRHWSLYDSMFHSSYVASKLGVWREKGRNRLLNLLTKMGISRPQFQQPHMHMNVELRNLLRTKINTVGPEYGLHGLQFQSFARTHGWECTLSSADTVYGVTALLECSPQMAASLGAHIDWMGEGHPSVVNEVGGMVGGEGDGGNGRRLGDNFYTACDALDNIHLLRSGVDLSMRLQRVIVRQGTSMIERQSVKTLKSFRLAVLRDEPDLQLLCHPLTLSKLSIFLVEAMREYGKTNLPFVIAALDEQQGRYLVVGVTGSARHGDVRKNNFGLAFQATAARTGARVKHDSFETSVLEIKKEDLAGFMESLQSEVRS